MGTIITQSEVRWYRSTMEGAPAMTSQSAGSMIDVLKKCLIEGFGERTDFTASIQASGHCTVTFAAPHAYLNHQIIAFSGADVAFGGVNGTHRIYDKGTHTFKFVVDNYTGPADTLTGTLAIRVPPQGGWEVKIEDTSANPHKCILGTTSQDPTKSGYMLYLEDDVRVGLTSNTSYSRWCTYVQGCNGYTDIDTRESTFGSWYWAKSRVHEVITLPWFIAADDRMFYFAVQVNPGDNNHWDIYVFGDIESFLPFDQHHSILVGTGNVTSITNSGANSWDRSNRRSRFMNLMNSGYKWIARNWNQVNQNEGITLLGARHPSDWMAYGGLSTPNPAGNQILYSPIWVRDATAGSIRGRLPGCLQNLHNVNVGGNFTAFADPNTQRLIMLVPGTTGTSASWQESTSSGTVANSYRQAFFDIVGPWR